MISFYQSLIGENTRSLLELGCGTGTVTLALAGPMRQRSPQARIVGVDCSPKMLRIARERDSRIEWRLADMPEACVPGGFGLVVCCYNTLQELLRDDDLLKAFRLVRGILDRDGIFAFDIYNPDLEYLRTPRLDRLARRATDRDGRPVEVREDYRYDPVSGVLTIDWRLIRRDEGAAPPIARLRYYYRQYSASDVDRLLAAAGLAVRERYGDFDRSPFAARSRKQILVCGRA